MTEPRKRIVAGNWKMHGDMDFSSELAGAVAAGASDYENIGIALCPPFPYLAAAAEAVEGTHIHVGAQDVAAQEGTGAYTGEVSGEMLRDVGCWYALVGHSERRSLFGDSNEIVAAKYTAARAAGLVPVLCLGETLEERDSGRMEAVLAAQLDAVMGDDAEVLSDAVIAYEPVWAIGTGRTATPQQAQDAHAFIRARIAAKSDTIARHLPMLYGGSVKPANAAELFAQADVDGGLIGGASLNAEDFLAICAAAAG